MKNNLITNDPLVERIFQAVDELNFTTAARLRGIIRAGKIAELYESKDDQCIAAVSDTFSETEIEKKFNIHHGKRVI